MAVREAREKMQGHRAGRCWPAVKKPCKNRRIRHTLYEASHSTAKKNKKAERKEGGGLVLQVARKKVTCVRVEGFSQL